MENLTFCRIVQLDGVEHARFIAQNGEPVLLTRDECGQRVRNLIAAGETADQTRAAINAWQKR